MTMVRCLERHNDRTNSWVRGATPGDPDNTEGFRAGAPALHSFKPRRTRPRPVHSHEQSDSGATVAVSDEQAAPLVAVHFLGTFRLMINGVEVDTASRRRSRDVLAYLLAHGPRPVPQEVLMDVFWPAAEPDAARNSLHVSLSLARRAFGAAWPEPVIERRFAGYRITDRVKVWSDVEHFEASCDAGRRADRAGNRENAVRSYEAACQLYEGDFLAEEPYTDWAASPRDRLRLQAVEIQTRLLDLYLERADYGPAILLGRQILTLDPCNEQVHRRLMTCYSEAGQRHLALSQYRRMAVALWEAFQVHPSAEATALYSSLRHPLRNRSPRSA
jgi:SARP family transcriptional regulator, regulator of embCAB operon